MDVYAEVPFMLFLGREGSREVSVAFGRVLKLHIKNSVPSFPLCSLKETLAFAVA